MWQQRLYKIVLTVPLLCAALRLDPLTQPYGVDYLYVVLTRELAVHREQQQPLSVIMCLLKPGIALGARQQFIVAFLISLIIKLIKQQLGNTSNPTDEIRRNKAHLLLIQGNVSNRQLAKQLGYSDDHNFRRAFKRWTGILPSSVKALMNQSS